MGRGACPLVPGRKGRCLYNEKLGRGACPQGVSVMEKIMIVEDDPKIGEYLRSYIMKYGYRVEVLEDFDNLMGVFRSFQPDLVLLDINLPRFDGFYWCRQIRLESICPVLFISARTGE